MMEKLVRWIEERGRTAPYVKNLIGKIFPRHWSFLLGEIALYSFLFLVASGIFLLFHYTPESARSAYEGSFEPMQGTQVSGSFHSVMDLSFDVRGGLLVRQAHHWAALIFTAAITLHAARVFFTGSFRRPRHLNWVTGVALLMLALANGFFGLSLTDDLLSGTGLRIAYTFAQSVPMIGPDLASLVFAGEFPSAGLLERMYWLHILFVPVAIAGLVGGHLFLVFRRTHTQFGGKNQHEGNVVGDTMWPGYVFKTTGLLLFVAATALFMGGLVQINPVWIYGPYDPAAVTVPAQPDWYLWFVEGALRVFPQVSMTAFDYEIPTPFVSGLTLPLLFFAALLAWPWIEQRITGDRRHHHLAQRPRDVPVRTTFGVVVIAHLTVLTLAGSHDVQGYVLDVGVDTMTNVYRVLLVAVPVLAGAITWWSCQALREDDEIELAATGQLSDPPPGADSVHRDEGDDADKDEGGRGDDAEPESAEVGSVSGRSE
jgi:ubiquinol-cytochrome c reductase cytochrome b subunit